MKLRSRGIAALAAVVAALAASAAVAAPLGVSSRNCGQLPNGGYCSDTTSGGINNVEGNANNPPGSVQCYVIFAGGGDEASGITKPRCDVKPRQLVGHEGRVYNRHGSSEEVGIAISW